MSGNFTAILERYWLDGLDGLWMTPPISMNKFLMFCFQCHRRLLLEAQIAQGSLRGPFFNPPQDYVLGPLKRPSVQAQRTLNFFWL